MSWILSLAAVYLALGGSVEAQIRQVTPGTVITLENGKRFQIVAPVGSGFFKDSFAAMPLDPPCNEPKCYVVFSEFTKDLNWAIGNAESGIHQFNRGNGSHHFRKEIGEVKIKGQRGGRIMMSEFSSATLNQLPFLFNIRSNSSSQRLSAARLLGEQLYQAMEEMHKQGWVHMDIKPDNLFLRGGYPPENLSPDDFLEGHSNLTLGDFDLSQYIGTRTQNGDPMMMAPEFFFRGGKKIMDGIPVGPSQDIYAGSVSLYQITMGEHPAVAFIKAKGQGEFFPSIQHFWTAVHEAPEFYDEYLSWVANQFDQLLPGKSPDDVDSIRAIRAMVVNGLRLNPNARKRHIVPHRPRVIRENRISMRYHLSNRRIHEQTTGLPDLDAVQAFVERFCVAQQH